MRRIERNLLIATGILAAIVLLVVSGAVYYGTAFAVDSSIYADFNSTAQDAMEEGTFIQHVEVVPDTLRLPWRRLRFGRAWIHEDSHLAFRWLVQRKLVREGTYTLCFNLANDAPEGGMSLEDSRFHGSQWLVDVESGLRYQGSQFVGEPWRFCRPVSRPFPTRVAVEFADEKILRSRMSRFVGAMDPPAPAQTQHKAEAVVQGARGMIRLTHTQWNGMSMLWISEQVGESSHWRVRRVLDYPGEPINYVVRYGSCRRPAEPAAGTLVLLQRLEPAVDINSAWRVDAETADLVPVPVQDLSCEEMRRF